MENWFASLSAIDRFFAACAVDTALNLGFSRAPKELQA